jgi:hypothetical protein
MNFETFVLGELNPQPDVPSQLPQPQANLLPTVQSLSSPSAVFNPTLGIDPGFGSKTPLPTPAVPSPPSLVRPERPPTSLDAARYLASYSDLIEAFGYDLAAASDHYFNVGRHEGRRFDNLSYLDGPTPPFESNLFSEKSYLSQHKDLQSAYGSNLSNPDTLLSATRHYIEYGYYERRDPFSGGTFAESPEYVASHDDLIGRFGLDFEAASHHYWQYGRSEGREVTFQSDEYLASYGDLIQAFGYNPDAAVRHYITYGAGEGRARDQFDAAAYLNAFPDLQAAFGNNLDAATQHYVQHGYFEGRIWG